MSDELVFRIALSKIPKVGAVTGKTLVAYCGGVQAVFEERKSRLLSIPGIGEGTVEAITTADPYRLAENDMAYISDHDLKATFYLDDDYPARLKHHDDSPLLLYSKGVYEPNPGRTVAIVGTRKPSPYGQSMCEKLVNDLAAYDIQIVSGLAYGVDAIAHKTACDLGIENLAVMGTGMDTLYPASHRSLAEKICNKGALLSEYPVNMRADKENFPRRNRVIAAMADVVVVVESAKKGGSLITAEFANGYFKDVFAFPGRVSDKMSAGCNALIKQNKAHLIESAKDIGYIMRWETKSENVKENKQQKLFLELNEDEKEIVDLIREKDQVSIDFLHLQLGIKLSELSSKLLQLEMKGVVVTLPGSRVSLR